MKIEIRISSDENGTDLEDAVQCLAWMFAAGRCTHRTGGITCNDRAVGMVPLFINPARPPAGVALLCWKHLQEYMSAIHDEPAPFYQSGKDK